MNPAALDLFLYGNVLFTEEGDHVPWNPTAQPQEPRMISYLDKLRREGLSPSNADRWRCRCVIELTPPSQPEPPMAIHEARVNIGLEGQQNLTNVPIRGEITARRVREVASALVGGCVVVLGWAVLPEPPRPVEPEPPLDSFDIIVA